MVNPKRLIDMARKWRRVASLGRRASAAGFDAKLDSDDACRTSVADKGHFVVYTTDRKRGMVPLAHLESSIFVELLKKSEEEFGLPNGGPITLPCDAVFLEHILSLLRRRGSKDLDGVLLDSVFKHHHSLVLQAL